jgi:DNA-binding response OmpR family regulator
MSQSGLVLLIDDEPQVVDLLRDALEAQGYSVMSALNGRDALVLASLTRPDAVLLDIRMSPMQGPEVLRGLRELDPSISVVMVSGADDEDLARELLQSGAFDYVRKPFMFDHLDTIVRLAVLVGRRAPLRELPAVASLDRWTLAENELDASQAWCGTCQGPVAASDTSSVRQGGTTYHAACWLGRVAEAVGTPVAEAAQVR